MIHIITFCLWSKIDGKIEAPKTPKEWENTETESWLWFKNVEGLFLNGSGILHPHGETWWQSVGHSNRPRVSHFQHNLFIHMCNSKKNNKR